MVPPKETLTHKKHGIDFDENFAMVIKWLDQINDFDCCTSWVGHTLTRHEDSLFEWQLRKGGLHLATTRIFGAMEKQYGL